MGSCSYRNGWAPLIWQIDEIINVISNLPKGSSE